MTELSSRAFEKGLHHEGLSLWQDAHVDGRLTDQACINSASCAAIDAAGGVDCSDDAVRARSDVQSYYATAIKWVDGGCRLIESTAKYFAAMAQTRIAADAVDHVRLPWPCFAVRLPDGLIADADGDSYSLACFAEFKNVRSMRGVDTTTTHVGAHLSSYMLWGPKSVLWLRREEPLIEMLMSPALVSDEFDVSLTDNARDNSSDSRVREIVCRAVVGLLYTMQHTPHHAFGGYFSRAAGLGPSRHGPPLHRSIVVGRPIHVDVVDSVKQDARSGARSSPTVQTLVRGHIKRQPFGAGRMQRKLVWIEPYWRGPDDAPIVSGPYRVQTSPVA